MAALNETRLRETLISRGLCDLETAVAIGEVAREIWAEGTSDFATEDKIAIAIGELRSSLLEVLHESERLQTERHERLRAEFQELRQEVAERDELRRAELLEFRKEVAERDELRRTELLEFRKEVAERDERNRQEAAERDAGYRNEQAARDRRTQWLVGLGFTAFGALASVLAVFT